MSDLRDELRRKQFLAMLATAKQMDSDDLLSMYDGKFLDDLTERFDLFGAGTIVSVKQWNHLHGLVNR